MSIVRATSHWAARTWRAVALLVCTAAAGVSLPSTAQLALSFSFDETAWSNGAGQVADGGPFNLDGTPFGSATTATEPPSCRYGIFDGVDDYVEVPDNAALDIANELTVAAWIYMRAAPSELHTIVSKDTNYEYHIDAQRRLYWWWDDSVGNTGSLTGTTQIGLNQWHHVAVTYRSGEQRLYVDGTLQGSTGSWTGTLATNDLPFYVGTDWNFLSRAFDGYIDEVRVLSAALTAGQIQALRSDTQPCAPVRFTITHDAFGINCVAETITVNVIDRVAGTPVTSYNRTMRLDTLSGGMPTFGSWALVAGTGTFSDGAADDGIATYTWPLGESQASFALRYTHGPPAIDVDASEIGHAGVSDDDSEGAITFSPNGFTVTAAALPNPPGTIMPFATHQTAGTPFTLHIAAFGQTASDPECGIIEEYSGVKSVKFWSQYVDPNTGARNVTIDGATAAAAEAGAGNHAVVFSQGQAAVAAKYKDVGRIRIFVKDETTVNAELPAGIAGATAAFVSRPFAFTLSEIGAGALANPQAVDGNGPVFLAAGADFRATVTARDSEGDPTPNYGRESIAEGVRLETQLVAPIGGSSPAIGSTVGFGDFGGGEATGTDFTWSEVGIMRAVPRVGDGDYLTAGDVVGPPSEPIGRFVPDHFAIGLNAPLFATACAAGGFTYQGQPFSYTTAPVITATAVAANGAPTTNYAGAFFKLTNATVTGRTYSSAAAALDVSGLPAVDPVVLNSGGGVATLTFGHGSGLKFAKGAPQAPFSAGITLAIDVIDADGVAAVGPGPFGNPVTFGASSGIPFTQGQEIRYGRARVGTAVGSELVDLPVPMRAEYFAGAAGFVPNLQDVCATDVALAFAGYTKNLHAGETCVRDSGAPGASGLGCAAPAASPYREPPVAGDFNLRLAAPGANNQGSVSIQATVPPWLMFDWNTGMAGDENPVGQATFGLYDGERRLIYTREIY